MASMDPVDTTAAGQEMLSQSAIERLLAQVAEQAVITAVHQDGGARTSHPTDSIQLHDFRHPVFLSPPQLRRLRVHHEEFIHSLAARLSVYLRLEFGLQPSQFQTLTYQKFTESLSNPCHLTLFKVEPLRGICVLNIHPRLGLSMVDRLMGGPDHSVTVNRELSEIEVALLDQIVHIIIGEWCNHWSKLRELHPVLLGHENSGRFLQTSVPDAIMIALTMEARIGECVEQFQIGFPYTTLEPLLQELGLKLNPQAEEKAAAVAKAVAHPKWNHDLADVRVPVTAEWPGMELAARSLARLKVGDVLPLPMDFASQIELRLAQMPKFQGRLGTRDQHWAVEVTKVLRG